MSDEEARRALHHLDGVVFVEWTATGTNTGEGSAPPTGNAMEVSGLTKWVIEGGKIAEEYVYFDSAAAQRQLGGESMPHAK